MLGVGAGEGQVVGGVGYLELLSRHLYVAGSSFDLLVSVCSGIYVSRFSTFEATGMRDVPHR